MLGHHMLKRATTLILQVFETLLMEHLFQRIFPQVFNWVEIWWLQWPQHMIHIISCSSNHSVTPHALWIWALSSWKRPFASGKKCFAKGQRWPIKTTLYWFALTLISTGTNGPWACQQNTPRQYNRATRSHHCRAKRSSLYYSIGMHSTWAVCPDV